MRRIGFVLATVVVVLLLSEAVLQVAALFAPSRLTEPTDGRHVVLCVGDSHTHGAGVAMEEAYPSHLQRLLDQVQPAGYAVVNAGIPGFTTTNVRKRLPKLLARYRPAVVVFWVGVNDSWNVAEVEDAVHGIEKALGWLRIYRLFRVRSYGRVVDLESQPQRTKLIGPPLGTPGPRKLEGGPLGHEGRVEAKRVEDQDLEIVVGRAMQNLVAMAQRLGAHGIHMVVVRYPLDVGYAQAANRAIDQASQQADFRVVDASRSIMRLPASEREFLWAVHPNGAMYGEVAKDVLAQIREF